MIYLIIWFSLGIIITSIVQYCEHQNGKDLTVADLPFALFFTCLWPLLLIIIGTMWLDENFDKVKKFIIIKGKKKSESKEEKEEEFINEFEEDEGDY